MNQIVYTPGTVIAGKYKIERAIARGGCSIVYKGHHEQMGRPVALKLMAAELGTDMGAWAERFRREARLASQLRHANTITTFDYGAEGDLLYIVMEWVEGDSLRNLIKREGAMEAKRTAKLSAQLLRSLAEAHSLGILHRDLKPSNIMITTDAEGKEVLKVLDFGLAKAQLDPQTQVQLMKLTQDGDFVGTPRYASPEQLRGRELTTASDIYGVGMVMWEMLTGKPAVPDIDFGTCVQYHLGKQPWLLPPDIHCPPGLTVIVERSLAKNPQERYQRCEEMLAELDAWIAPLDRPAAPLNQPAPRIEQPTPSQAPPPILRSSPQLPPSQDEPLLIGQPLERPAPARVEQPKGPSPKTFDHVDGNRLELDRRVAPAKPAAPAPAQSAGRAPLPAPDAGGDEAKRKKLIAGALVLLVLLLASALGTSKKKASVATDAEAEAAAATAQPAVAKKRDTPSADVLLSAIRRANWQLVGQPEASELGGVKQTTARLGREKQYADVSIYECDDNALAMDLMINTESPTRAVRLGRTVVRISPISGKNSGVDSLQRYVYKIRDIYEGAGFDAGSDLKPPDDL